MTKEKEASQKELKDYTEAELKEILLNSYQHRDGIQVQSNELNQQYQKVSQNIQIVSGELARRSAPKDEVVADTKKGKKDAEKGK